MLLEHLNTNTLGHDAHEPFQNATNSEFGEWAKNHFMAF